MNEPVAVAGQPPAYPRRRRDDAALDLSVVIPCYNEEASITATIDGLEKVLAGAGLAAEIVVVNDGSTDGSAAILEGLGDRIRVLANKGNLGYGASLKRGFRRARAPLICIIDADGTYPADAIPALVHMVRKDGCHMAVASRTGANVAIPLIRRPAKWFLRKLANYVAGETIPDINSGLRVFPRQLAEKMSGVLPDGFSLTTTITLAMLTNGYGVAYRPIDYFERAGRSKIRPIRDTLNFLQLTLKMALYFAPVKVFIPLSVFLVLAAVVWGLFTFLILGQLADVTTLMLVMTAIQVGAIGLLAELVRWRTPTVQYENDGE